MTLDARKGRILQAIVDGYVATAEPIGSEWLASRYDFGCKSATLRNEMADMSELGYLLQPHTSAGRIPSTRGYRYYVDRLMEPTPVGQGAEPLASVQEKRLEIEDLVQQTARMLAEMTRYPSVATSPLVAANHLHRLYVTNASARHLLVVALFSTGHVEHRLVEVGAAPADSALHSVTDFLNERLGGREVNELATATLAAIPGELAHDRDLLTSVFDTVRDVARGLADSHLFLEGTSHILRQREFQDVLRLEQLLNALEQRSVLFEVFSRFAADADTEGVAVIIGDEHPIHEMADCSVVTSAYWIGERRGGYIGVVGPTRMNYPRAVSAVGTMARSLSHMLTRACLG